MYFGSDLGFEYIGGTYQNRYEITHNGISLAPYETKTVLTRNIPKVSAFSGVNYFLTRRLCFGLEINISYSIDIQSGRTTS